MQCRMLFFELLHYLACILYCFVQLYVANRIILVKDMWDLQLRLQKDYDNLEGCLS
jgi:hypothetical protein